MIVRRVAADRKAFSHLAIAVESRAITETLQLLENDGNERAVNQPAGRSGHKR
jgi:hypothetical protein